MSTKVYFLGGTSPQGFKSKFIEQIKKSGYYTYILKERPGDRQIYAYEENRKGV